MSPAVRHRLHEAVVVSAAALALATAGGCTGYSGTRSHQVSQWALQYTVVANDQTVLSDISAIKRSLAAGQLKDVTSNCAGLVTDAGTGYGNLPTPDNTLTDELSTAYQDFANAGSSCAAAGSLESSKVKAALRTIAKGLVPLGAATRRLAADGVH